MVANVVAIDEMGLSVANNSVHGPFLYQAIAKNRGHEPAIPAFGGNIKTTLWELPYERFKKLAGIELPAGHLMLTVINNGQPLGALLYRRGGWPLASWCAFLSRRNFLSRLFLQQFVVFVVSQDQKFRGKSH